MRCARINALDYAADLLQLFIKCVWFCRRPAVSAISTSVPRERADCAASKTTAPGVGTRLLRDDGRAGTRRPDLQLLERSGAEGIPGGEHDAVAGLGEALGKLADGRGLAGAVHAHDQDHIGVVRSIDHQRLRARREHIRHRLAKRSDQRRDIGEFLARDPITQIFQYGVSGFDADIRRQQPCFQLL